MVENFGPKPDQPPAPQQGAGQMDLANFLAKPPEGKEAGVALAVSTAHEADRHKRRSYLDSGVNLVTQHLVGDNEKRDTINHYAGEFLKTAALFTPGKIGVIGTVALHGLAQASPADALGLQAQDMALGMAKGGAIRGAFSLVGKNFHFAPTKGILIGTASRAAEAVFQRDLFTDPSAVQKRLGKELVNPQALAFDAVVFGAGEGLFAAGNRATGGALSRSPLIGSMSMGATFGVVSGGVGEIMRQQDAGEGFDAGKVAKAALIRGALDAAAGGVGAKIGEHTMGRPRTAPTPAEQGKMREFVITDGKDALAAFRRNETDHATLRVKGPNFWNLGEKTLFVQRLDGGERTLKPGAAKADIIATCHPENLTVAERSRHAFPSAEGRVWIMQGAGEKIALSTQNVPMSVWAAKGYRDPIRLDYGQTTVNVMSPLLIGDPAAPHSAASKVEWQKFDADLKRAKELGIDGVSTDVWWGMVERKEGKFDWAYYDKVAKHVNQAGLKWIPILSFHKAGGNVGDTVNVDIPHWIWEKAQSRAVAKDPNAVKFVSEQGNASNEFVSFWATPLILDRYANVMRNFQEHYKSHAPHISEINISLGPSGELRYPSYNSHDQGAGWPTRGAIQAYSSMAQESFRDYAIARYGSIDAVGRAWGIKGLTRDAIRPPNNPDHFFSQRHQHTLQYGRDFYDWYNQSLINHGRQMMRTAVDIFGAKEAPFHGIELGAKIPGVHWRVGVQQGENIIFGDRLAELNAGLIRTSRNDWHRDADGRGYRPILDMFKEFQPAVPGQGTRVVPIFTAMEMPDGVDGPAVQSMPNSLAKWFGIEARRQGMIVRGENALAGNLGSANNWNLMHSLLDLPNQPGYYNGMTFLRMSDVVNNPVARAELAEIIYAIRSIEPKRPELKKGA
jgi:beta-amylase